MSKLKFELKVAELRKAFKEQRSAGRVVFKVPFVEDEKDAAAAEQLYGIYVEVHRTRRELGRGSVVVKRKIDKQMVEKAFDVRILAAEKTKKEYQISVRFNDNDLYYLD